MPVRQRWMIRRVLCDRDAEEATHRQTLLTIPGDASIAIDVFEAADEVDSEVDTGQQRQTATS